METDRSASLATAGGGDIDRVYAGAFTFLFAFTWAQVVLGMGMFWHRRHKHPVRGHSLALVTIIGFCLALQPLFLSAWQSGMRVPCWMFVFFQFGPGLAVCVGYFIRAFRIHHFYTLAAEKAKRDQLVGVGGIGGFGSNPGTKRIHGGGIGGKAKVAPVPPRQSAASLSPADDSESDSDTDSRMSNSSSSSNGAKLGKQQQKQLKHAASLSGLPSASDVFKVASSAALFDADDHEIEGSSGEKPWRRRRRWVWTDKRFGVLLACLTSVCFLVEAISFIIAGGDWTETVGSDGICPTLQTSGAVFILALGLCVILLFVAVWKLRRVYDAYRIKSELAMVAFWMVITIIVMVYSAIAYDVGTSLTGVYVVVGNLIFFHSVTYKALVSYDAVTRVAKRAETFVKGVCLCVNPFAAASSSGGGGCRGGRRRHRRARSSSKLNLMSSRDFSLYFNLERCLDDPEAAVAFEESLTREWAIENLLFYRSVSHFADSYDADAGVTPHERARLARAIFEEFVERGASSQVNISAECYDNLVAKMEECMPAYAARLQLPPETRHASRMSTDSCVEVREIPSDLFADAAAAIFALMETDSFVRFKTSSLFRSIADSVRRRHSDPDYVKSNIGSNCDADADVDADTDCDADTCSITLTTKSTRESKSLSGSGSQRTAISLRRGSKPKRMSSSNTNAGVGVGVGGIVSASASVLPECKSVIIDMPRSGSQAGAGEHDTPAGPPSAAAPSAAAASAATAAVVDTRQEQDVAPEGNHVELARVTPEVAESPALASGLSEAELAI